jgi:hypothetical protein
MLAEAERRFGGAPAGRVSVANPGDAASIVTVYRSDAAQLGSTAAEVSFDGTTGRVLAAWNETRPAVRTYSVIYGLHMGRFSSGLLRWLYFLGGAMLTLAVASGLILWVVKRREKAPLSRTSRFVERLNAGVIAGVPIGCIAYLCANRLLPSGVPERASAEVDIAFAAAGAALLVGMALPPRRAWPVLLAILAAFCLAAPLIGHGPGLLRDAFRRGDGAIIGLDMVVLCLGLGAAALASRFRRSAPARAAR